MLRKLSILLAVALMLAGTAFATQSGTQIGDVVEDFEIDILDGETVKLSDFRGKKVFINLWTTTCPYCIIEMPDIEQISKDYADELVVIAINMGESVEKTKKFVEENGYTFNFATDTDFSTYYTFPISSIPVSLFIDEEGVLATGFVGSNPSGMYDIFAETIEGM